MAEVLSIWENQDNDTQSFEIIDNEITERELDNMSRKSEERVAFVTEKLSIEIALSRLDGGIQYDIDMAQDTEKNEYFFIHNDTKSVLNIPLSANKAKELMTFLAKLLWSEKNIEIAGDATHRDIVLDDLMSFNEIILSKWWELNFSENEIEEIFLFCKAVQWKEIKHGDIEGSMDDKDSLWSKHDPRITSIQEQLKQIEEMEQAQKDWEKIQDYQD